MIRPAFQARGEMQYLPSGAGKFTHPRHFAQLGGDLSVMLGSRSAGLRGACQCPTTQTNSAVNTDEQKMIASATFARSPRVGSLASWLMMTSRSLSIAAKSARALIGLAQRARA